MAENGNKKKVEAGMKTENVSGKKNKRKEKNIQSKAKKWKTKHIIVLTALGKLEEN